MGADCCKSDTTRQHQQQQPRLAAATPQKQNAAATPQKHLQLPQQQQQQQHRGVPSLCSSNPRGYSHMGDDDDGYHSIPPSRQSRRSSDNVSFYDARSFYGEDDVLQTALLKRALTMSFAARTPGDVATAEGRRRAEIQSAEEALFSSITATFKATYGLCSNGTTASTSQAESKPTTAYDPAENSLRRDYSVHNLMLDIEGLDEEMDDMSFYDCLSPSMIARMSMRYIDPAKADADAAARGGAPLTISPPPTGPCKEPEALVPPASHQRAVVEEEEVLPPAPPMPSKPVAAKTVQHSNILTRMHPKYDPKMSPKCTLSPNWDVLTLSNAAEILQAGNTLMNFACRPATHLETRERELANLIINVNSPLSGGDNYPSTDLYSKEDCDRYTMIVTRATYLLPNIHLEKMTPYYIASMEYQKGCIPGSPYLWPKQGTNTDDDLRTFRITKPLIPFVFSLVVQMRTTEITDAETLRRLEDVDKLPVSHAILFERTRRSANATDSTAKVRSILLYYALPDNKGVLVTNFTVVCNNFIPKIVAKVVQSFGSRGAGEVNETAQKTRKFLLTQPTVLKK
eukprot:PhM_4_TR13339/c3_g1_i1/m.17536